MTIIKKKDYAQLFACFSAVLCLCYLCSVLRSEKVNVFSLPVVTEFG